jgi:hypothetical protein
MFVFHPETDDRRDAVADGIRCDRQSDVDPYHDDQPAASDRPGQRTRMNGRNVTVQMSRCFLRNPQPTTESVPFFSM